MKLGGCDSERRLSQALRLLGRRCIQSDCKNEGQVRQQHDQPGDFAVMIYYEIKDARREIGEQNGDAGNIESARKTIEKSA